MLRIDSDGQFYSLLTEYDAIPLPRNMTDGAFGQVFPTEALLYKAMKVNQGFILSSSGQIFPNGGYVVISPDGRYQGFTEADFLKKFKLEK